MRTGPLLSRRRTRTFAALALTVALASLAQGNSLTSPLEPGLVVERVTPGGAGALAGLRAGDVLLGFAAPDREPLGSCSRFAGLEIEEAARGPVALRVRRGQEVLRLETRSGDWQVEVRPLALNEAEDRACLAVAQAGGLVAEKRWEEAWTAYREAERLAAGDPLLRAWILYRHGDDLLSQEGLTGLEEVRAIFQESLELRQRAAPDSLAVAASWHGLGRVLERLQDLAAAHQALGEARALRSRLAPGSAELARSQTMLAVVERSSGQRESAWHLLRTALAIVQRRLPGGRDEAIVLNNLAIVARDLGDYAEAERLMRRAVALQRRIDSSGNEMAGSVLNLGALAMDRGDLATAEEMLSEALRRFEALSPDSRGAAMALTNLGHVARERFDFHRAQALLRRALAIRERSGKESLSLVRLLGHLAFIAQEQGRLDEAEALTRRALAMGERIAPGSDEVISIYSRMGHVAARREDMAAARRCFEKALALRRAAAPGGSTYSEASLLQALGQVALAEGRPGQAVAVLRRSVELSRRISPGSGREAGALYVLGLAYRRQGRLDEAEAALAASLDAVENQARLLGGSDESRSGFHLQTVDAYHEAIDLAVERGRTAEALATQERSRARNLLEMLAARDLVFDGDVPGGLLGRQRRLDKDQADLEEEIASLDPVRDGERLDELRARLSGLRSQKADLVRRIAQASPHYASLRHARPLDLAAIRRVLDPGTLWLSWSVTAEKTFLFVVAGDRGLQVHTLPAGSEDLAREVGIFRSLILRGREHPDADPALVDQGRKLFDLLLAPAAAEVARADRLLVSADGPLQTLPFSALVAPGGYLMEAKPVHRVLSATLYAEIQRSRRTVQLRDTRLAVFGEPSYPVAPRMASAATRAGAGDPPALRYRRGLSALPFTRLEAGGLATLYGPGAEVFLGAEATEARLRELGKRPRILHFATHALLDRRFPLDSALALAPGGGAAGDDGLLHAWEIFEKVRLDADLVTLSACETGLGGDAGGEGLIGLTRAFQYAGARSVLASLWSVSDRSTSLLMRRFYTGLHAGATKDEALRQAQLALLRKHGGFSHPYHWAGFELTGDWR